MKTNYNHLKTLCLDVDKFCKLKLKNFESVKSAETNTLIEKRKILDIKFLNQEVLNLIKQLTSKHTPEALKEFLEKELDRKSNELIKLFDAYQKEKQFVDKKATKKRKLYSISYFKSLKSIIEHIKSLSIKLRGLCGLISDLIKKIIECIENGQDPESLIMELEALIAKLNEEIKKDEELEEKIKKIDRDHVIIKIERPAKGKDPAEDDDNYTP